MEVEHLKTAYPYRLTPEFGSGPHRFCGEHGLARASCPNCGHVLLHVATLDVTLDPLLNSVLSPLEKLVLLFCWRCPASQRLQYKILNDGVQVLDSATGVEEADFPYPEYPDSFPEDRFSLVKAPEEHFVDLGDWNDRTQQVEIPRNEFGGQPRLWQPISAATCLDCGSEMEYLGTIADANTHPRGFTDNSGVMMLFFLCPKCPVIHATNQID